MFKNIFPIFERGAILKKDMLDNIRDYPRVYLEILYKNYTNGIITGCEIEADEENIILKNGIIKYKNNLYFLDKILKEKYTSTNKKKYIRIKFEENLQKDGFIINEGRLCIEENQDIADNEIEIGNFKLKNGAKLRTKYSDFFDLDTEFNTLNIIDIEYACENKSTLSPLIINMFADIILNKSLSENNIDIMFGFQILNNTYIRREVICAYISKRLRIKNTYMSNREIYINLCKIAKELLHNQKISFNGENRQKPNRIIIE